MTSRRKFMKLSALATSWLLVDKAKAAGTMARNAMPPGGPVVISTWKFGLKANRVAWEMLQKGARALDAVEGGVRVVESDPTERSVGLGGRPDRDGIVSLDACIMDDLANIGAVAYLQHIVNPISVARAVMEKTPHAMLAGDGALQFALAQGFKKENLLTGESEKDWKEWLKKSQYKPQANIENHDTIGMIAIDKNGNLSGACTTSGLAYKMHGRVGDSPIIGAGLFVDHEVGAATATGHGEEVIRTAGSHTIVELMRQGFSPRDACRMTIERIVANCKRRGKNPLDYQIGFLALNKAGEIGAYALQKGFDYAVSNPAQVHELLDAPSAL